jgi:hypothetical protein
MINQLLWKRFDGTVMELENITTDKIITKLNIFFDKK